MALPMHYGTNPFLKGTPAGYKAALGQPQVDILDMRPGDTSRVRGGCQTKAKVNLRRYGRAAPSVLAGAVQRVVRRRN